MGRMKEKNMCYIGVRQKNYCVDKKKDRNYCCYNEPNVYFNTDVVDMLLTHAQSVMRE